jgi:hypothetical protein
LEFYCLQHVGYLVSLSCTYESPYNYWANFEAPIGIRGSCMKCVERTIQPNDSREYFSTFKTELLLLSINHKCKNWCVHSSWHLVIKILPSWRTNCSRWSNANQKKIDQLNCRTPQNCSDMHLWLTAIILNDIRSASILPCYSVVEQLSELHMCWLWTYLCIQQMRSVKAATNIMPSS